LSGASLVRTVAFMPREMLRLTLASIGSPAAVSGILVICRGLRRRIQLIAD